MATETKPKPAPTPALPGLPGTGGASPFSGKPPETPRGLPGGPANNSPGGAAHDDEEFEEDFENVSVDGFIYAEGRWPAVVSEFEKQTARPGQKADSYVFKFRFTGGPDAGKEISDFASLAPNARWKVVQNLEACGIPAAGTISRFKRSDVLGKPVDLEIYTDTYYNTKKGRDVTGSKIREVLAPSPEAVQAAREMGATPP